MRVNSKITVHLSFEATRYLGELSTTFRMNSRCLVLYLLAIAMVLFVVLTFEGTAVAFRGRGGGRGGGRGSSRSSSRSRSSRTRISSSRRSGPRIYPNTPIAAKSYSSPVIRNQAKQGFPSKYNRALVGSLVTYNVLARAPVYRGYYPMFYRSTVYIPQNRALRIRSREVILKDIHGQKCVDSTNFLSGYNYSSSNDKYLNGTKITVKYQNSNESAGENVTLEAFRKGENISVISNSEFSRSVITSTNCTRVTVVVSATVVEMYSANPDADGTASLQGAVHVYVAALLSLLLLRTRWW